ncbi:MAG: membrane protein insertion efficiency factor YidD [Propionibacteriaceae bacterium]|jgi:putative membrane protein insertion efficiency factor|nr:membrane protein insertion efficiency factor YidD [Propionibacteriaceae bacterium]
MKWFLMSFVKVWRRLVSPLYGDVCRYYPTCSAYALDALQTHGALHGSVLAVRRICRCHPWTTGGFDPVPGSQLANELAEKGYISSKLTTLQQTQETVVTYKNRALGVIS